MKILFFGSDYYSTIVLHKLLQKQTDLSVVAVITGVNSPQLPFPYSTIADIAADHQIPTFKIADRQELADLADRIQPLAPDLGLVASFGYLIPPAIFSLPRLGTLNIHPSLLPQYRGPSPIQQAILGGLDETGVTLMQINEKFDEGAIIAQTKAPIYPTDTSLTLGERLFCLGTTLFLNQLKSHIQANLPGSPQPPAPSSLTRTFTPNDARIDWSQNPLVTHCQIRAFYPKSIAWTSLDKLVHNYSKSDIPPKWQSLRVKIYQAELIDGKIQPLILQVEGKVITTWREFERGYL